MIETQPPEAYSPVGCDALGGRGLLQPGNRWRAGSQPLGLSGSGPTGSGHPGPGYICHRMEFQDEVAEYCQVKTSFCLHSFQTKNGYKDIGSLTPDSRNPSWLPARKPLPSMFFVFLQ